MWKPGARESLRSRGGLYFSFFLTIHDTPNPTQFAIITPPIISGAFTERIAYLPYMVFIILFSLLVYCPIVSSSC